MNHRLIIFNIIISCVLIAAPVDLNKAQRVAGNIYAERSNTGTIDDFNLRSVDIIDENSENLIYIFQIEPHGFIMVSGDDRVRPMLAYSFESAFIMEDMPSNLSWMMDAYKGMISSMIASDESATEKVYNELLIMRLPTASQLSMNFPDCNWKIRGNILPSVNTNFTGAHH